MTTITSVSRGWRKIAALAAVAALALLLTGLRESPLAGAASGQGRVGIDHFAFHPGTLRIHRGSQVAFTNESGIAHTATRAGSFDTGRIAPGKTKVVTFGQSGTFAYHCTIHPFMKGKVVVE
jgi:plastocyanin